MDFRKFANGHRQEGICANVTDFRPNANHLPKSVPVGTTLISRWLSEATPTVYLNVDLLIPEGSHGKLSEQAIRMEHQGVPCSTANEAQSRRAGTGLRGRVSPRLDFFSGRAFANIDVSPQKKPAQRGFTGTTSFRLLKNSHTILKAIIVALTLLAAPLATWAADVAEPSESKPAVWFDSGKTSFAILTVAICGTVIVCTELARRGKPFYVRPIAGLQAIEEAVGRSTEMGRPMLFVPGIQDINEIDTVAGLTVLSSVAKMAAEYDTPMEVPTTRALVMTAAREAVQAAALAAGRPDYYDEQRIYYVTDEQFGYVASVCGWMYREKPAACFFLGKFYAESLILAETGNAVGSIQIAGTAETTQLPFFVAACDYTLLGEELFAASAYLSGEPAQLGMLKGQDFGKLAAMVLIVIGSILATWDSISPRGTNADGVNLPRRNAWITESVLKGG